MLNVIVGKEYGYNNDFEIINQNQNFIFGKVAKEVVVYSNSFYLQAIYICKGIANYGRSATGQHLNLNYECLRFQAALVNFLI